MEFWERKGEYSGLKLDGNNNSTMVRYQSNSANSTIKSIDIVCQGRTRFDLDIRPTLQSRESFKNKLIEIGEKDTMAGDWGRKVFANNQGLESENPLEYPPASMTVNIGNKASIKRLNNLFQAVKSFSNDNEKDDLDNIQEEIFNNISQLKIKLGKRSRVSFERA